MKFWLSESKELARAHTTTTANLPPSLGFVINKDKLVFESHPGTRISWFPGKFSNNVPIPPKGQGERYQEGLSKNLRQPISVSQSFILSGGKLKLSSSIQVVFPAPLHYRFLLRAKNVALKKSHSYKSILPLDQAAQQEFLWLRDHLAAWNGRSLLRRKEDLVIETDASNLGCGASCNGIRTGGDLV